MKVLEAEVGRGRKSCRRRAKQQKLSKGSDEKWQTRRKDTEIRGLLSSDSSGYEGRSPPRTLRAIGQLEARNIDEEGPTLETNYCREA
jgi:hypothetical protein